MHVPITAMAGLFVVGLLTAGCAGLGGASEHYPEARRLNLADISEQAGKDYEREVCECVRRDFANALNTCISALPDPDLTDFEMIVTIEQDGSVDAICLSTETEVSECLREALLEARFPQPPFAPFHGHVSMRLR